MKKLVLAAALLLTAFGANAQTNIQEMYDFGRGQMTTTLEMYQGDNWGSTFFFTDIYHTQNICPTEFYTEIARSFNFWGKNKSIGDRFVNSLSLHVEWNGGCRVALTDGANWGGYPINNAWLYGVDYFIATNDFSKRLTLEVMYKDIRGGNSKVPLQFTAVWGIDNLFNVRGLSFSGFADFWWEDNAALGTSTIFLTEPQLWYQVGRHFKCDNLFVGGEVEIGNNFAGVEGWAVNPCLGLKWGF